LPLLGKRFVRESADKSGERRLALCDLAGNEYVASANKKDIAKLLFDSQEGACAAAAAACLVLVLQNVCWETGAEQMNSLHRSFGQAVALSAPHRPLYRQRRSAFLYAHFSHELGFRFV
jgi:hypothetical protein